MVFYLMSGPAHLPYLIPSLWTLRQWYDGPITVQAWPESFQIVRTISMDVRLGIACVEREPKHRGRNSQFLDKIDVAMSYPVESVCYFDADTTFHGPIDQLLESTQQRSFVATQFCNWTTNSNLIKNRLNRLTPTISSEWHHLIKDATTRVWPSVNGGVWTADPTSPVLKVWYEWTLAAKEGAFIADEAVLHLLQCRFLPTGEFGTICEEGRWNCSPIHQSKQLDDRFVIVRHYHGDSNVRPNKSKGKGQRGVDLWWPIYQECLKENVGGMADWRSEVKNKYLDPLEKSLSMCG